MHKKHFTRLLLSITLSVSLMADPAISAASVYAAEVPAATLCTADELSASQNESPESAAEDGRESIPENDGGSAEEPASDIAAPGDDDAGETADDMHPAETQDEGSDAAGDAVSDPEAPSESDGLLSPEDEQPSDNDIDENTSADRANELLEDADFAAFAQSYTLSSEQIREKENAQEMLDDFSDAREGIDYVADQVFFFADTENEAQEISDAYHGELTSYLEGVACVRLGEYDVEDAVYASFDMDVSVPVMYPNYIRQYDAETIAAEAPEAEAEGEQVLLDNAQALIVEEVTACEDAAAFDAYNDPYLSPTYDSSKFQWHHAILGTAEAWNAGYTGAGIKVGVLDSGVYDAHSDLALTKIFNASGSNINDSYSSEGPGGDTVGHGTMVCGTIAAQKNNKIGGVGVAPDVSLYSFCVNKDGSVPDYYALVSIRQAIAEDVDVINMSFGSYLRSGSYDTVLEEAYNAGIVVVAAAGNENTNAPHYPSSCAHVISVAATDRSNQRAYFSTYGSDVDLSAPGVEISTTNNSGGYKVTNGTSFSSPIVAGEAALLLQAAEAGALPNVPASKGRSRVDALEKYMKNNAAPAGSGMGNGILYLPKALCIPTAAQTPLSPAITYKPIGAGQSADIIIRSQPGTTIYYTKDGKKPCDPYGDDSTIHVPSNNVTLTLNTAGLKSAPTYTISAIAVNSAGASSSLKRVTIRFKPNVTGIELSGVKYIPKGKSASIQATVTPSYAVNKSLTWAVTALPSGAPKGCVKVSGGKVTVAGNAPEGSYTITASAKNADGTPGVTASFSITVTGGTTIKEVKFRQKNVDLKISSQSASLDLKTYFSGTKKDGSSAAASDFLWRSSKPAIASVNSSGVLTAYAPGTITVTALANDGSGKKAVLSIKIAQLAESFYIIPEPHTVAAGRSNQIRTVISPANTSNKKLKWIVTDGAESNAADITGEAAKKGFRVSAGGKVSTTAKTPAGTYYVRATTLDGSDRSASAAVQVVTGHITSIKLTDPTTKKPCTSATIFRIPGNYNAVTSASFVIELSGSAGCDWSSVSVSASDPQMIGLTPVSQDGNKLKIAVSASGMKTGTAKVAVASTDGSNKKAVFKVKIVNPPSSLILGTPAKNADWVIAGESVKLSAVLGAEFGKLSNKKIKWDLSCDEDTAAIKNGKVTTSKKAPSGRIMVVAYLDDGSNVSAVKYIYINADPVKSIECLSWPKGDVFEGIAGKSYSGTVTVEGTQSNIEAISSKPTVAGAYYNTRNGKLYVVCNSPGTTKITVRANDGGDGKTTSFNVIVSPKP